MTTAVAMVELSVVPAGLKALDGLVKEAEVTIIQAGTVQCGRYLILFGGAVEPTQRALAKAEKAAGGALLDSVLLPDAEPRIVPAIAEARIGWPATGDTLGVVQTATTPVLLQAVERGLKGALVELVELRVADGLGGQGLASFWGEVYDVEAALELAMSAVAAGPNQGGWCEIIRNADPEVAKALRHGTTFYQRWRG